MLYIHATLINPNMRSVTSLLLILLCFNLHAQNLRNYTSYTVDNGLAQNSVWDAYQDYKGFMWFGTADGINRFDGYNMYHYRPIDTVTTSISGNTFYKFIEDSKQRLWVSHNKGISIYNRAKDCFINLTFNHAQTSVGETYTYILGEDKKGRIWFSDFGDKFWAISIHTFKVVDSVVFQNKNHANRFPRNSTIFHKYIVGAIYDSVTTWFRLNTETKEFTWIGKLPYTNSSFTAINDSTLITYSQNSLFYYNPFTNQLTQHLISSNTMPSAKSNTTGRILWWKNNIWIGNNYGLFVIDPRQNKQIEHIKSFDKNKDASFFYVQNLWIDKSNNLWICTNGAGVHCLSPQRNKFKHLCAKNTGGALVKSITTDKDGNIYTGFYADGLIIYDKEGEGKKVELDYIKGKLKHVLALTYFNNTLFYVHNENIIAHNNSHVYHKNVYAGKYNMGITGTYITYPFFKQHNNRLYVSVDYVIMGIDKNLNTEIILPKDHFKHQITCFEIFNDTTWWVATVRNLYRFNPITKETVVLNTPMLVKTIYAEKHSNKVWVGGNTGLYLLTKKGKQIKQFSIQKGLPDDFIYGILEDNNGNIWMSHNKGISVYSKLTKNFTHYSVRDGLQSNEFNTGAYHKDANGLLYFGGVNGINIINPKLVMHNTHAPPVAINQILLGDLPYKTDTAYNEITQLQLSYLQNTLSFDFSALEFSQPEDNTYQYILEGYDKNWIESGTLHFARYANLPAGNYTFKVLAANGDGVWSKSPKQIYINIIPPFWQRTWFYLLMAFVASGFILVVVYLYNKRQQNKLIRELEIKNKLEQERIRISRDLHDNVGAQLSYLITNIDWMLRHPEQISKDEEAKRLQSLSEAGRNAILTLRQTIWAVGSNSLSVDDFADRFKQFAQKMLEFDKSISVTFKENISPGIMLSPAVALNIFRICQEAFNNCLKHSNCNKIHIIFKGNTVQQFLFSITDNGKGFDTNNCEKTNQYGIQNMKARAKECNATLNINSTPGKGTNVTITLN